MFAVKKSILFAALALALAACGGAPAPSPEAKAAAAAEKEARKSAETFTYAGKAYEIAVLPNRKMAYISGAEKGVPFTGRDLEKAAKAHTGCKSQFQAGVLAMIGGFTLDTDLQDIKIKKDGHRTGWSVALNC
jgi:ABC-type glycerol-3-phosphate transport system substrate-binding protein